MLGKDPTIVCVACAGTTPSTNSPAAITREINFVLMP